MTSALTLQALTKRYGGSQRPALDHVDLEVEAGSILVLLGQSGAGKTTLLRVVAGLEDADAGRVLLQDVVVADPASRVAPERRGVGLVFQHLELWTHMSVAENIAFGLPGRPRHGSARTNPVVRRLAQQVGVEALLRRSPATLSGGERQRVAIARTLAPDPKVILYDEPLANLDPERRQDLRRLIRTLCRERGTTLVYVTHDADEAMEMGDRIAVLDRGRLAESGTPEGLYARPRTLAGARALGSVNVLPGRLGERGIETALGWLDVGSSSAGSGPALALVRPEEVVPGDGVPCEVVETRPHGAVWSFEARLDGLTVLGRSPKPLSVGSVVTLGVAGPAAVVPVEEST